MNVIADLQLHSRFSRAVSPQMTIPNIARWARRKGIGLVATGDWTHPMWLREIEQDLEEMGNGLLRLRTQDVGRKTPLFLLATEVSSIYSQGGKLRRVHTLIWVPTIASAEKINKEMTKRGCNLLSDGRPIVGLSCIHIAELVLSIEPKALIIPAHAWTPHFSVYGSVSGFDSIEEAFGPFAKHIYAVETGLSSNPAMNWRIAELDHRAILSFSDAHSGPKLGREATVFDVPEGLLSYDAIYRAIVGTQSNYELGITNYGKDDTKNHNSKFILHNSRIAYTIEFYPEEGKYHYTGHRACGICWSPQETQRKGKTCPVCGKSLTIGVMHRIQDLAGRSEEELQLSAISYSPRSSSGEAGQTSVNMGDSRNRGTLIPGIARGVQLTASAAFPNRPPFVMLVPLQEIIAEAIGSPVASPKVQMLYARLTEGLGGEFAVLLSATLPDIATIAGDRIAQGIDKVRRGDLVIDPGYDGVFGVVKLWREGEDKPLLDASREQLSLL